MENFDNIDIRTIEPRDIETLVKQFTFPWADAATTRAKWQHYYKQQQAGERLACVIEKDNKIVGYGSLVVESSYPPFAHDDVFEIHDIWINAAEREQGLGALLITYLESVAEDNQASHIGMGVGLYADYGAAQRLYMRLGYMPDGAGITYKNAPVVPGKQYPVDDHLLLWLVKELSPKESEE